jgi:hypothetical protein
VSALSIVQDSGAPAWLSTAARDPILIVSLGADREARFARHAKSASAEL